MRMTYLHSVYDPKFRAHLSYATLRKYISTTADTGAASFEGEGLPQSVVDLLDKLSNKVVTGNAAKEMVVSFLRSNEVLRGSEEDTEELEIFGRLLDRNLVAGFGARTLSAVRWKETTPERTSTGDAKAATTLASSDGPASKSLEAVGETKGRNMEVFPVALGKSIEPPFSEIAKSSHKWFASRKLDGVRVIAFLDFRITESGVKLVDVEFRSRTGKVFTSLDNVKAQLLRLKNFPNLREWLARDGSDTSDETGSTVSRLVLDGEICVMKERPGPIVQRSDEGTGVGSIWANDNLEEDFTSTVSEIRRHAPYTIAHPVYFIFDITDHSAFDRASSKTTFGTRVKDLRTLERWLTTQEGEKVLRPLTQWEVNDIAEIDEMVSRAAEEGWEGLVLRADRPYKGSRS